MNGLLRKVYIFLYYRLYEQSQFPSGNKHNYFKPNKLVRPFPSVKRQSNRELVSIIMLFTLS